MTWTCLGWSLNITNINLLSQDIPPSIYLINDYNDPSSKFLKRIYRSVNLANPTMTTSDVYISIRTSTQKSNYQKFPQLMAAALILLGASSIPEKDVRLMV